MYRIILVIFILSFLDTPVAFAIEQTVGTSTNNGITWYNTKDVSNGDNLTTGVPATGIYVFDGTNWDRAKGDQTNGIWVNVKNSSAFTTVQSNLYGRDPVSLIWTPIPGNEFGIHTFGYTYDSVLEALIPGGSPTQTTPLLLNGAMSTHTWTVTGVTCSALNITFEGSLLSCGSGGGYFILDTYTGTTNTMRHVVNKLVRCIKIKLNSATCDLGTELSISWEGKQ